MGRTHLHYNARCEQHLGNDKNSSIFKHLGNNKECKESYNKDSFKILDNARTRYELALKEGMQIKWRKPSLNIQKKSMKFLNCSFNCVLYSLTRACDLVTKTNYNFVDIKQLTNRIQKQITTL